MTAPSGLVDLPSQPQSVPWPTSGWPRLDPSHDRPAGADAAAFDAAWTRLTAAPDLTGTCHAVVAVHRGRLVREFYGHLPETVFGPGSPVGADTPLVSWSMAKSITHALVGTCVADGLITLDRADLFPQWWTDERSLITVEHLLQMRPGLEFVEDYVDAGVSHVIEMLFGAGKHDVAAYAAGFALAAPPGTRWNYSSGTTNLLARLVGEVTGGEAAVRLRLRDRVFGPVGMTSAEPGFDEAGTFVGSSWVHATAQDFARFGYLYLRDGCWDGRRVLPSGWVDLARTPGPVPVPDGEGYGYGAHWWLWPEFPGLFAAHGFRGQRLLVDPVRDLVVVRLGDTPTELQSGLREALGDLARAVPAMTHHAAEGDGSASTGG